LDWIESEPGTIQQRRSAAGGARTFFVLPLSLIPTFLVPLFLILHVICIGQAWG
jgi:hypothetical protein